jgi:PilZ domain
MANPEQGTRRDRRKPGRGRVQLEWPDSIRGRQVVSARIIDISENGMKVALPNAIAPGTYVQIKCKEYALSGMAGVKHCSREKMGYNAGLEFSGFQWRAPDGHAIGQQDGFIGTAPGAPVDRA